VKIAITGGSGFVGRHLARSLVGQGHEVVLIARGVDRRDESVRRLPGATLASIGTADPAALAAAFAGCDAVAHLAGINRELGTQTYPAVHVEGTRHVVDTAKAAGMPKVVMLSFLRARPECGSPYHESKWAAEELMRHSGLDYAIVKAGVIYGRGDHMLDHLSHAFYTFPVFGLVGLTERPVAPVAVADVVRVLEAGLLGERLSRQTVAVIGPEVMPLGEAVRRVAAATGRRPLFVRLPLAFHYAFARVCEWTMVVPLLALAQARILSEGVVTAGPGVTMALPDDLVPRQPFDAASIRAGLPPPARFGRTDLRCCAERAGAGGVSGAVAAECPEV
jgi:NADH dehydrogenase